MKKIPLKYVISAVLLLTFSVSCKKEFLNTVPNNALKLPESFGDFQELLDNQIVFNEASTSLGNVGSDDYYLPSNLLTPLPLYARNEYKWDKNPYPGTEVNDWDYPYRAIYYANTVLTGLSKINPGTSEMTTLNSLRGTALFHRAHMYFQLSQLFAPPYNQATASTDLGLPLRSMTDVNEKLKRSTVQDTYNQIIIDLKAATSLLPNNTLIKSRPTKYAGYGLLSRVYLQMGDFPKAKIYADSALQSNAKLIDYNSLDSTAFFPIQQGNSEVLFACQVSSTSSFNNGIMNDFTRVVDTLLYQSYDNNDLRKPVLFKKSFYANGFTFLGSYNANSFPFGGIAIDEIYLIRAECNARAGNITLAMADLNFLLSTRWKTGTYVNKTAISSTDALTVILSERKKELIGRGLRWIDLRRLNIDPQTAITIKRIINGQTYSLPPNDLRYTWLIPDNVISFNPGMEQNKR